MGPRVIYYTPYPDSASKLWFGEQEKIIWASSWEEVMDLIKDHGEGTEAAVLADGTIQYYK